MGGAASLHIAARPLPAEPTASARAQGGGDLKTGEETVGEGAHACALLRGGVAMGTGAMLGAGPGGARPAAPTGGYRQLGPRGARRVLRGAEAPGSAFPAAGPPQRRLRLSLAPPASRPQPPPV